MTTGRGLLSEPRQQDGPSLAAHTLLSAVATYTNTMLVSPCAAPAGEEGGRGGEGGVATAGTVPVRLDSLLLFIYYYY